MKKILSSRMLHYVLIALGGIFIGWIVFQSPKGKTLPIKQEIAKAQIWTCSMDPQIKKTEPGDCPICGMHLIPLVQTGTDTNAIELTKEAIELAKIQTTVISSHKAIKEVRLFGKVQPDERLLQSQVAYITGRVEKLLVNYTGETVHRGQTLAVIYSSELISAQQELLEAAKSKKSQPEIYDATKEKLRQWKITDAQIAKIESTGKVQTNFDIVATTNGVVMARRVNNGDYISQGSVLFDIADLSSVWIKFDAYESDLPFLNKGDKVSFTIQALPDTKFNGTISFIEPTIDPTTRVAKLRVEIKNPDGKLKPEMFVTGMVKSNLENYQNKLIIPRSAVLWTGKRSIVYVKQADATTFKIREIELGPVLGNSYVVLSGIKEGEEIVTQGTFSVDAAAQLEGKPSMMAH